MWRIPAAGGQAERLTSGATPQWTPDSQELRFYREGEAWNLSLMDRTERQLTDLSGRPGILDSNSLTVGGRYLYFLWEQTTGDIWVMDVATDEEE